MTRTRVLLLATLPLLVACGAENDPPPHAGAMADASASAGGAEREATLGPFLAAHWTLPIAPQGDAPADWSPLEADLDPAACGTCHPKQFAEWQGSLHAGAFSPGFAGQLIEGGLSRPRALRDCQRCHAPLAEQLPVTAQGKPSPHYDAALRSQGLACAVCHVREQRRFGPPRRADAAPLPATLPHGGFEVRDEYQQSRFCAPCHQFFDTAGVNGKPIENTFFEWQQSPQAAEGQSCQSCHMPGRAHLWRGIHDPEMVRGAVQVHFESEGEGDEVRATLRLTSHGVGHRLPTYVTPRIYLEVWQEDGAGRELTDTQRRFTIGRKVDFRQRREIFDTRIAPGESAELVYRAPRAATAQSVVGRVTVAPDFHYRGVFENYLPTLTDPEARRLIETALHRSERSRYVLQQERHPL